MYIPTQYIPIRPNRPKPLKENIINLDKTESNPDTTHQQLNAHVIVYEKREGNDRRKRKMKPLLDTRVGRDRRFDENKPGIDIKA